MRPTRRRRPQIPIAVALTFSVGVLVASTLLTMLLSSVLNPLDCITPERCTAPSETGFLPRWTGELRSALELQEAGFRGLAGIGTGLALVLLGVVAVNLGTRLGARSLERRREVAMRAVLGATPWRLLRPLIRELGGMIIVAALAGALAGVGVASLLRRSWPLGPAPWSAATGPPLWIAFGVIGLLGMVVAASGLWSALIAWQRDLRRHLNTGDRATPPPSEGLLREGFVILQVAGALVLTVSGALLVTAFHTTSDEAAAPGHPDGSVSVARLEVVGSPSPDTHGAALQGLLDRIRAVPGVTDTSLANDGAVLGMGPEDRVTALCPQCRIGSLPKQQTSASAHIRAVGPDYFRMLGLGIQRGREFEDEDGAGAPRVAIVSRAFALRFFPGGDPVGQELRLGDLPGDWYRVVGVADDLPGRGLGSAARGDPVLYLSLLQQVPASSDLLVQVDPTRNLAASLDAIGMVLAEDRLAEAPITIAGWTELQTLLERERSPLRWFGILFLTLAAGATLLAAGGLYDLMTHLVAARRREIGVRMALGADSPMILRLIMRRSRLLVGIGVVIGIIPLGGLARLLQLRYEGVDPWNPLLAGSVAALLLGIALAASYRPARDAARVDPLVAMRG